MSYEFSSSGLLVDKLLKHNPGNAINIAGYNYAIHYTIPQMIEALGPFKINDNSRVAIKNVTYEQPMVTVDSPGSERKVKPLLPAQCRRDHGDYFAKMFATFYEEIKVNGVFVPKASSEKKIQIGAVPIMVLSTLDYNSSLPPSIRYQNGEMEQDPGGYFIVHGTEKSLQVEGRLRRDKPNVMVDKQIPVIGFTSATHFDSTKTTLYREKKVFHCRISVSDKKPSINIFHLFFILGLYEYERNPEIIITPESVINDAVLLLRNFIPSSNSYQEKRAQDMEYILAASKAEFIGSSEYLIGKFDFGRFPDGRPIGNLPVGGMLASVYEVLKEASSQPADSYYERVQYLMNNIRAEFLYRINMQNPLQELESKRNMLAFMVVRLTDYLNGYRGLDNINSPSNKEFVSAGSHIVAKVAEILKPIVTAVDTSSQKNIDSIISHFRKNQNQMQEKFVRDFRNNSWKPHGNKKGTTIVDTVTNTNAFNPYIYITSPVKIITPGNRQSELMDKRIMRGDSFHVFCPTLTPDNQACGLIRDPTFLLMFSMERNKDKFFQFILPLNQETQEEEVSFKTRYPYLDKFYLSSPAGDRLNPVFINGRFLGFTNTCQMKRYLDNLRRRCKIYSDTGLIYNASHELWIYTTGRRPILPLLTVDYQSQELVIDRKDLRNKSIYEIFLQGAMEYVDAAETIEPNFYGATLEEEMVAKREEIERVEKALLAAREANQEAGGALAKEVKELEKELNSIQRFTHMMVDPSAILGKSAASITDLGFNPGNRNLYMVGYLKQSLVSQAVRARLRFDVLAKTLSYTSVPLISTEMSNILGFGNKYGMGNTVFIAILNGKGNEEDAIEMSRRAIQLGFMKYVFYYSFETVKKNPTNATEYYGLTDKMKEKSPKSFIKLPSSQVSESEESGLFKSEDLLAKFVVREGVYVKEDECLVAKYVKKNGETYDSSLYVEKGKEGIVDEVYIKRMNTVDFIQIRIRKVSEPQVGDKFTSGHGQKGVIGKIYNYEDGPYIISRDPTYDGIVPTIKFNALGVPSRMTVAKMMEEYFSHYAVATGKRINATAFRSRDVTKEYDALKKYGFENMGEFTMMNGETGVPYKTTIFTGAAISYNALPHNVLDKASCRSIGEYQFLTHQPVPGHRKKGGLRFGEMERDTLIANGATYFLRERMNLSSDTFTFIFCDNCGNIASPEKDFGKFHCRVCKETSNLRVQDMPYPTKLLRDNLAGVGIKLGMIRKSRKN